MKRSSWRIFTTRIVYDGRHCMSNRYSDMSTRATGVSRRDALRMILSVSGLGVLSACTATNVATAALTLAAKPTAAQPTSVPRAQVRTGGTLRYATTADVATLDPYLVTTNGMETSWLVFDRLTAYDANLKQQPVLAESWDFSSSRRENLDRRHRTICLEGAHPGRSLRIHQKRQLLAERSALPRRGGHQHS